jgi:hypothetical protein
MDIACSTSEIPAATVTRVPNIKSVAAPYAAAVDEVNAEIIATTCPVARKLRG